jgi:hypothetical protein
LSDIFLNPKLYIKLDHLSINPFKITSPLPTKTSDARRSVN